jgi:thiamine transport system permease protein
MPAVVAAAVLVFLFCFTSFGVVLVLGGPRFATIEVEIYRQTVQFLNLPLAAALSVLQILFTLVLMATYTRLQGRLSRPIDLRSRRATERRLQRPGEWAFVLANLALSMVLLLAPLGALAARSVTHQGRISLAAYAQLLGHSRGSVLLVPPVAALWNSLRFALSTVGLSVAVGLMAALAQARRGKRLGRLRRWIDVIYMLPLGTSAVTLGLGYIVALDSPPLNLRTSPVLIVLAHSLIALPFVVRSVTPALRSIRPQLREAAASLGAPHWRVLLEIDVPIVSRAAAVGAVFAFTVSMGEFGATSLIVRPERPTMPVAIYRLLSRPGATNYGQAVAMSTLLMLVCTVGFLAIERVRFGPRSEF